MQFPICTSQQNAVHTYQDHFQHRLQYLDFYHLVDQLLIFVLYSNYFTTYPITDLQLTSYAISFKVYYLSHILYPEHSIHQISLYSTANFLRYFSHTSTIATHLSIHS